MGFYIYCAAEGLANDRGVSEAEKEFGKYGQIAELARNKCAEVPTSTTQGIISAPRLSGNCQNSKLSL